MADNDLDPAYDWTLDNGATINVLARYHVDHFLDSYFVDIGAPCANDDCTRTDHVNLCADHIPELDDVDPVPNIHVVTADQQRARDHAIIRAAIKHSGGYDCTAAANSDCLDYIIADAERDLAGDGGG